VSRCGRVWIQGAGELASGVAWRLCRSGYRVIAAEVARPRVVRRLVAFAEAVRSGEVLVEGVPGRLVAAEQAGFLPGQVTVVVDPSGRQLERLRPAAIIDGRMTKQRPEPLPAAGIPVIGLGPGFRCGRDAVAIVETKRGPRLGAVIEQGEAAPDTGMPGMIGGETLHRLLRAPAAGHLRPLVEIGDLVSGGQMIGEVGGEPLIAQISGTLRGIIHPDVELFAGEKVGDVDPRGAAVDPRLISDKALAVAGGVLEALLRLGITPDAD
jgi:xanthine dehydrogenase accessory factor